MTRKNIMPLLVVLASLTLASLAVGQSSIGLGSERVVKVSGYASVDAVRPGDKFRVAVVLDVADGYHINANKPTLDYLVATSIAFELPDGIVVNSPAYPDPVLRSFEFEPGARLAVHEGRVTITAEAEAGSALGPGTGTIRTMVDVQSCNDTQCLAPATLKVEIPLRFVPAGAEVKQVNTEVFTAAAGSTGLVQFGGSGRAKDSIADSIAERGLVLTLLFVFISGLALNTTPCVYPIIPITISFFANQGGRLGRTFKMAATYVIGMAITYSVLGVVASMTRGLFGAALQNPVVLIGLAALMVGLAFSMFGVYEFRLPEFLNRFATKSTQSTSGMMGALVMGLTMGIVAAPCIGPFVLALLVHVGTKGDPVYGFFMFFVLAIGLGLPYLILGTFSGALKRLPRSGEWMVTVRKVFGLVLIGMALYFLMPLLGEYTTVIFVAFFAASALYLIFWESGRTRQKKFAWVLRSLGVGAAVIAVAMGVPKKTEAEISWQPYSEERLAGARKEGKAVIIDAYADWCIPCKELDKLTFTDADVKREAEGKFATLKLDLTKSDDGSEAARAREKFDILGVPTIIFIEPSGRERSDLRLEGFEKPARFLDRINKVQTTLPSGVETEDQKSKPMPDVSVKLLDGSMLDLKSTRGKVVLIDFWATWCIPCLAEIPIFNALNQSYKSQGVEIVAIALDEEGAEVVKPFLKAHPMNYTIALGDFKLAEMFGVNESIPVTIVVDKQGRMRFTHVGVTSKDKFESEIKSLLREP